MQRRSSPKQRANDKAMLAVIAAGGSKPVGISAKAWAASLRRLASYGLVTFGKGGWRIK